MGQWNKLLATLDQTFGFTQKEASKVTKRGQSYDNKTQEHVIWLEYRVRSNRRDPSTASPNEIEADKAGVVKQILAENGQPVEYGQSLVVIV